MLSRVLKARSGMMASLGMPSPRLTCQTEGRAHMWLGMRATGDEARGADALCC